MKQNFFTGLLIVMVIFLTAAVIIIGWQANVRTNELYSQNNYLHEQLTLFYESQNKINSQLRESITSGGVTIIVPAPENGYEIPAPAPELVNPDTGGIDG